jgi:hypothetical protein
MSMLLSPYGSKVFIKNAENWYDWLL